MVCYLSCCGDSLASVSAFLECRDLGSYVMCLTAGIVVLMNESMFAH